MNDIFSRNELIWGKEFQEELTKKHIVVVGLGGVGGLAAESLARSGIGKLTLIDFDTVSLSNVNRQLIALQSSVGRKKTNVIAERLQDVNKNLKIIQMDEFYTNKLEEELVKLSPDYVIDAIDTLKSKMELNVYCHQQNIKIIACLGAGNRVNPTMIRIDDISNIQTLPCDFSKSVLRLLRKNGVKSGIKCIYSLERPTKCEKIISKQKIQITPDEILEIVKTSPGSTPFVPAICGYFIGYAIVEELRSEFLQTYEKSKGC